MSNKSVINILILNTLKLINNNFFISIILSVKSVKLKKIFFDKS